MTNSQSCRLVWVTDPHLPHASPSRRRAFLHDLGRACGDVDGLVVTGDIAEARSFMAGLVAMQEAARAPLYFVLGNHDFYGGSVASVRASATDLANKHPGLTYLTAERVISLNDRVALVGHDGWGDARCGNWRRSEVLLSDFYAVHDLMNLEHADLVRRLRELGDEAAQHLAAALREALRGHAVTIVATHVPPFAEAAWHAGTTSDPDFLPYFACQAAGEAILEAVSARLQQAVLVLCGHTHGGGEIRPLPNVRVMTGAAAYGAPEITDVIEVY